MAIKKVASEKSTVEKSTKKTVAKKKAAPKKIDLVEKKLSAVVDEKSEDACTAKGSSRSMRKSCNFPWWGLFTLVLALVFASVLLYQYNKEFRANFSSMMNSTGMMQWNTGATTAKPAEQFTMNMKIVYNKDDAKQKETIDQYLSNVEKNLQNTKVNATWMDKNSPEGLAMIAQLNSKFLPIFVTDEAIKKHPQFQLFADALKEVNGAYVFNSEGMEYLSIPGFDNATFIGADPTKAKVVIIEYASLTCHYCQSMQPIVDKVIKAHAKDVSWVVKMYDRGGIDSRLEQAAECAADQGKFNGMVDAIYAKQSDLGKATQDTKDPKAAVDAVIKDAAKQAGANGDKVLACVNAGTHADKITKSTEEGKSFGVVGTPSFFVNKQFLGGAVEEADFTKLIEDELKK